jgi:hypothetical protein
MTASGRGANGVLDVQALARDDGEEAAGGAEKAGSLKVCFVVSSGPDKHARSVHIAGGRFAPWHPPNA